MLLSQGPWPLCPAPEDGLLTCQRDERDDDAAWSQPAAAGFSSRAVIEIPCWQQATLPPDWPQQHLPTATTALCECWKMGLPKLGELPPHDWA